MDGAGAVVLCERESGGSAGFQDIVPIVLRGPKAADRGIEANHALGGIVTCGVRVESAIDGTVLSKERG